MTETVTSREARRETIVTSRTGHIRSYGAMGLFLVIGLVLVTLIATALIFYYDTAGTNPQINAAFYRLA